MTIVSVNWIYDVFVFKLHLVSTWYRSTMEAGPSNLIYSHFNHLFCFLAKHFIGPLLGYYLAIREILGWDLCFFPP